MWYDNGSGGASFQMLESGVTDVSYTATGLTQGLSYQFKVKARNDDGFSFFSDVVVVLAA